MTIKVGTGAGQVLVDPDERIRVGDGSADLLYRGPSNTIGPLRAHTVSVDAAVEDNDRLRVGDVFVDALIQEVDIVITPVPTPLPPPLPTNPVVIDPVPQPGTPIRYPAPGTAVPGIPSVTEFADGTLPVFVEMAFGASGHPLSWAWTDLTQLVLSQQIVIKRGRADEHSDTAPSTTSIVLDNGSGALTPGLTTSPFYPHVKQGTPLRISWPEGETGLYLPGAPGAFADTPFVAGFDTGSTLDLRARVEPEQWSTGISWSGDSLVLDRPQEIATRWDSTTGRSWAWSIMNAGWPALVWWDGSEVRSAVASEVVAADRPVWLAVTVSSSQVNHWLWDGDGVPPADVTLWSLVGSVDAGSVSIASSSTPVTIGAREDGATTSFRGRVSRFEMRDGVNGSVVADPDWSTAAEEDLSVTDSTGKVWTAQGEARATNRRTRFVGTVDDLRVSWPYGDNAADGRGDFPSECRVTLSAAGLLRRLQQGQSPLRSTLTRHITSRQFAPRLHAYWPMEDDSGAVRFGSAIHRDGPMVAYGSAESVKAGVDDGLAAAGPIPTVEGDGVIAGGVAGAGGKWAVEWVTFIGEPAESPAFTPLITVQTGAGEWVFEINDLNLQLTVEGGPPSVWPAAKEWLGSWQLMRLEADGAGWSWTIVPLDLGLAYSSSGGRGSATSVTGVAFRGVVPLEGAERVPAISVGHCVVHDGLPVGWLAGADTAWVGESAAHRIWRLCSEAGIDVEVLGDRDVFKSFRGDRVASRAMGPQRRLTLLELLRDAARVDGGVLLERRSSPGLVYRSRRDLLGSGVVLELDAGADHVDAVDPVLDDQRLRNDVEVSAASGSSSVVVDPQSVFESGRYDTAVRLGGIGGVAVQQAILDAVPGLDGDVDGQNQEIGEWLLGLGTFGGLRYPEVGVSLDLAEGLADAWMGVDTGDLVRLVGLPVQHPSGGVVLMVDGSVERLSPTRWRATLVCSPGGPWV